MMTRAMFPILLLLVLGACASSGSPRTGGEPFTDADASSIRILVQNRNFSDARLYVLRRGARSALGVVGGKSDEEFTVDWSITDPVRIEINLLAGPTCTTEELRADPGDVLELQIDSNFSATDRCGR